MTAYDQLKQLLIDDVYVPQNQEQIAYHSSDEGWIFDFRRVLMRGRAMELIGEIFWQTYQDQWPFQIGTMEIAGVPLAVGLRDYLYHTQGLTEANAFFVRKSRKKSGLMRMIEGVVEPGVPIVVVDDLMNSGNSLWRVVQALEDEAASVVAAWSILRFQDLANYSRFANHHIQVQSIFELNDFTNAIGPEIKNRDKFIQRPVVPEPFASTWIFASQRPSLEWVFAKSQPVLDEQHIYMGSDNRTLWAIRQSDGTAAWSFRVGPQSKRKSIFSSPALYQDLVIFGSYDGNVYGLDKATGTKRWVCLDADWVGSSPAVAHDLGLVFVGMEFGMLRKKGGIIALDAQTGRKVWADYRHGGLTHGSPLYIPEQQQVVIGSNDGQVRCYDAQTGKLAWSFTTYGGSLDSPVAYTGFGHGDIKGRPAYSADHDYVIVGSIDGNLYIIDRATGHLVHHHHCEGGVFSNPLVYQDHVYFSSTDKHLYCMNLQTFDIVWQYSDHTRIFASPTVINGQIYIGTNAARLHELDPLTGKETAYFQAVERITNAPVRNPTTGAIFLPTYANELYCLERKPDESN